MARNTFWSVRELLGMNDAASTGQWLMQAAVVCAAVFLGALWVRVLQRGVQLAGDTHGARRHAVIMVSLLYGAATLAMFVLLAHRRFAELVAPRYLAPLVPVVLMLAASGLRRILAGDPASGEQVRPARAHRRPGHGGVARPRHPHRDERARAERDPVSKKTP